MLRKNKVDKDIIKNLYESSINEAFNPENEEKNKIIRQALRGPKSYVKNLKDLQKMGINKGYKEDPDMYPGETIYLNGPNGKQLSVDPDGTNVWHTAGDSRNHYKKELSYKNRNSKHYTKCDTMDFNGDRAKSFDYYNYLTKPENKYQDEVDNANKVKNYKDNEGKKGYNLPDEALTPEEKSLNRRARKYLNLKKDREELENKLADYEEDKKNLDKINKEIKGLHEGVLNETMPYGFEKFVDDRNNFEVKPGAIDELIDILNGASLLLYYMYEDTGIPNEDKLKDIAHRIDEIAEELGTCK